MASSICNLIVTAVLMPGIVPAAAAQTGGVLSGVVSDRAGNPVRGAVLTIVDAEQQGARVVVTDERGVLLRRSSRLWDDVRRRREPSPLPQVTAAGERERG
jgi:hypothetical protein